jgi:hypothetical protein
VTEFVAQLGLVFLLFFLGLEFSLERLSRTGRHFGLGGTVDLVVNAGAYTAVDGEVESAADLRAALPGGRLVMSRGSYYARAVTPVAKLVQRWRGNPRRRADGATL